MNTLVRMKGFAAATTDTSFAMTDWLSFLESRGLRPSTPRSVGFPVVISHCTCASSSLSVSAKNLQRSQTILLPKHVTRSAFTSPRLFSRAAPCDLPWMPSSAHRSVFRDQLFFRPAKKMVTTVTNHVKIAKSQLTIPKRKQT